jgi:hypothetical protein
LIFHELNKKYYLLNLRIFCLKFKKINGKKTTTSKMSDMMTTLSVPSASSVKGSPPVFIPKKPLTSVKGRNTPESSVR